MKGLYIVIAGPSGAGKDSVIRKVLKKRKNILLNVSYTSRKIRPYETNGFDYNFVTKEKFESMIQNGDFLEYIVYDNAYYGTKKLSKEELENNDVMFRKDVNGAISIKRDFPFVITFYIMTKNLSILKKRKGKRGKARDDIAIAEKDPAKNLDFLIINKTRRQAAKEVIKIIDIYKSHSMKNPVNIQFMDDFYN